MADRRLDVSVHERADQPGYVVVVVEHDGR
jgi:hypothetical protein